jgi:hypothetical protein
MYPKFTILWRKYMRNVLCLALILFGFIGVFSQERTISKTEFEAVSKSSQWAPTAWTGKSYRMIQTNEVRSEGKIPTHSSGKTTIDFASPTVSHLITEVRSGSKIITKSESIRIGDKTYKRNGDEAWIEGAVESGTKSKAADTKSSASVDDPFVRQSEYKYLGTEKLNNLTANVYLVVETAKRTDPATNQESITTSTHKYWFSKDGVKLKEDNVMETRGLETTLYTRLTVSWELDSSIKVEAPVNELAGKK